MLCVQCTHTHSRPMLNIEYQKNSRKFADIYESKKKIKKPLYLYTFLLYFYIHYTLLYLYAFIIWVVESIQSVKMYININIKLRLIYILCEYSTVYSIGIGIR